MTRHDAATTQTALDHRMHVKVAALIERGISRWHVPCPRSWLLSAIAAADTGAMVFTGFCATPAELHAVAVDPSAI